MKRSERDRKLKEVRQQLQELQEEIHRKPRPGDGFFARLTQNWETSEQTRRKKLLENKEYNLLEMEVEEDDPPPLVQLSKDQISADKRNEIFERRTQRLQEKAYRIGQETGGKKPIDWTEDEKERVMRLENAYNRADAKDIDELSKVL